MSDDKISGTPPVRTSTPGGTAIPQLDFSALHDLQTQSGSHERAQAAAAAAAAAAPPPPAAAGATHQHDVHTDISSISTSSSSNEHKRRVYDRKISRADGGGVPTRPLPKTAGGIGGRQKPKILRPVSELARNGAGDKTHRVQSRPISAGMLKCNTCNITVRELQQEQQHAYGTQQRGTNRKLRRCLQCQSVWYCCVSCQRKDWPNHRAHCRAAAAQLLESERRARMHNGFTFAADHALLSPRKHLLRSTTSQASQLGGNIYMFGSGMFGLLGDNVDEEKCLAVPTPLRVAHLRENQVRSVALGASHALICCTDGSVLTHGNNDCGQLGHGDLETRSAPSTVTTLDIKFITHTAAGLSHSVVATSHGEVLSFGNSDFGQLGITQSKSKKRDGSEASIASTNHVAPRISKELLKKVQISSVSCGDNHTVVLSELGTLYSFGDGTHGATGLGSTDVVAVPTLIQSMYALPVVSIATGSNHTLAITATGALYAWGFARYGAIGTGHGPGARRDDVLEPVRITGLDGNVRDAHFIHVAAGGNSSAAVTVEGDVYTWGENRSGQLGLGSRDKQFYPQMISRWSFADEPVVMIAVGMRHMLAVTDTEHIYAWGSGSCGQLGLGEENKHTVTSPKRVMYFDEAYQRARQHCLARLAQCQSSDSCASARSLSRWWSSGPIYHVHSISCGADISAIVLSWVHHIPGYMELEHFGAPGEFDAALAAAMDFDYENRDFDVAMTSATIVDNDEDYDYDDSEETFDDTGDLCDLSEVPNVASPVHDVHMAGLHNEQPSSMNDRSPMLVDEKVPPLDETIPDDMHVEVPPIAVDTDTENTNDGVIGLLTYSRGNGDIGSSPISPWSFSSFGHGFDASSSDSRIIDSQLDHSYGGDSTSTDHKTGEDSARAAISPQPDGIQSTTDYKQARFSKDDEADRALPRQTEVSDVRARKPHARARLGNDSVEQQHKELEERDSNSVAANSPDHSLPEQLENADTSSHQQFRRRMNLHLDIDSKFDSKMPDALPEDAFAVPYTPSASHLDVTKRDERRIATGWAHRPVPAASLRYQTFTSKFREARLQNDFRQLCQYIDKCFSSPAALNGSFLPTHEHVFAFRKDADASEQLDAQGRPTSDSPAHPSPACFSEANRRYLLRIGIDSMMLERFYMTLVTANKPSLTLTLTTSIRKLLRRMITVLKRRKSTAHADCTAVRLFAIVLQLPLLGRGGIEDSMMIVDICHCLQLLPPAARVELRNWWSHCYPADIFAVRLVTMLRTNIEKRLSSSNIERNFSEDVILPTSLMRQVYLANEHAQLIPNSLFFVRDVEKHVDMAVDFLRFADYETRSESKRPAKPPFTFARHHFLLNPLLKSRVLRLEHKLTQAVSQVTSMVPVYEITIRRDHLLEDAIRQLRDVPDSQLRKRLMIKFVGEEGIDAGGLTAEFLQLLSRELLSPDLGLFVYNEEMRTYWYSTSNDPSKMFLYRFAGRVIGLSCYNGLHVHINFPPVLYRKLLGQTSTLKDLKTVDPTLGQSLQQLLDYEGDDVEDVFCLTFEANVALSVGNESNSDSKVTIKEIDDDDDDDDDDEKDTSLSVSDSLVKVIELKPGGANIAVTRDNRHEYVQLYVDNVLHQSVREQANGFAQGFLGICNGVALQKLGFTARDLEWIICGEQDLDFTALEKSARYEGYTSDSRTVKWFWDIINNELTPAQQKALLIFVTGSDRSPLGGLSNLSILIQRASADSEMLPSSHVCFNTLLLPDYSSRAKLLNKLLISLANKEGFGLQ
jgi:alpha-tubulin suppressor-like RCC1 family protein